MPYAQRKSAAYDSAQINGSATQKTARTVQLSIARPATDTQTRHLAPHSDCQVNNLSIPATGDAPAITVSGSSEGQIGQSASTRAPDRTQRTPPQSWLGKLGVLDAGDLTGGTTIACGSDLTRAAHGRRYLCPDRLCMYNGMQIMLCMQSCL